MLALVACVAPAEAGARRTGGGQGQTAAQPSRPQPAPKPPPTLPRSRAAPRRARPQPPEIIRPRSLELAGGGLWLGATDLGSAAATLTLNQTPSASRFTLFNSESRLKSASGFEGRVGYNFSRVLGAEAALVFTRPVLQTTLSNDAEGAPNRTFDGERLDQYFVDGSLVVHLTRFVFQRRGVPFVLGGAGYLRQLHEGGTLVETGQVYHIGGGLKYLLKSRPVRRRIEAIGFRADARAYLKRDGFDFRDERRLLGAASGGLFVVLR